MEKSAFILCRNLVKNYGSRKALSIDHLEIGRGEIFGIIGPNGAGKSTFLSILSSRGKPSAGTVLLEGENVLKDPRKLRGKMGFVPQEIALYPTLSVYHNLDYWAGVYRIPKSGRAQAIQLVLEQVGLSSRVHDRVENLSGGMKHRLNLAAALMHQPDILILDEPTAGVDVKSRRVMADLLEELKNKGKTIVFTSHYIDELEAVCDRMAVLQSGCVLFQGTLPQVLEASGASSLEELMLGMEEV